MEYKSVQKFVRTSPRKLREVAYVIKDETPEDAFEKMPYLTKRAAVVLRKVLGTALANARQAGADTTSLKFQSIQINDAPRLKRWRAGSRGRAKPYVRRMSHITIVLTEKAVKKQSTKIKTSTKGKKSIKNTKKETPKKTDIKTRKETK